MSFLFDDASPTFDPNKLNKEQAAAWKAYNEKPDPELMKELQRAQQLFTGDGINGTYRIEVVYEYRRSAQKRCVALINVYRSNKDRALDLDQPLFFCTKVSDVDSSDALDQGEAVGCGRVLTGDEFAATLEGGGMLKVLWCDICKKYVNRLMLCSSIFMNNEPKAIAERVYKLFRELNSDADIVITHHKRDLKKAQEDIKGDSLSKARLGRERAMYPLKNIIKDAGDAGLVVKKITDFLSI